MTFTVYSFQHMKAVSWRKASIQFFQNSEGVQLISPPLLCRPLDYTHRMKGRSTCYQFQLAALHK